MGGLLLHPCGPPNGDGSGRCKPSNHLPTSPLCSWGSTLCIHALGHSLLSHGGNSLAEVKSAGQRSVCLEVFKPTDGGGVRSCRGYSQLIARLGLMELIAELKSTNTCWL